VERALTLVAAPADNSSTANADMFNRKWDKLVQKYREIIRIKLQDSSMEDIVLKACPFMKPRTNISSSVVLPDNLDNDVLEDIDMYTDL
jgi:hypothetical protein